MTQGDRPGYSLPHLKTWRISRFLTQAQLAEKAGISLSTVKYLESGKHPANSSTVVRLAAALSITPDTLIASAPGKETLDLDANTGT